MTISNWFKKHAHVPLLVLFGLSATIYISFLVFTYTSTESQQKASLKNLILTTVQLGLQKNDLVLIESAMERSIENLGAHAAFLCDGDKLLARAAKETHTCANLPEVHSLQRAITFDNFGFADYSLIFYVDRFPVKNSHLLMLAFMLFIFFILSWFIFNLRKNLLSDLINPLQNNLLSDQNLKIVEFENLKAHLEERQSLKIKQASLQAEAESRRKFAHNVRSPLRTIKSLKSIIEKKLSPTELKLLTTGLNQIEGLTDGLEREKEVQTNDGQQKGSHGYAGEVYIEIHRILRELTDSQQSAMKQNREDFNVTFQSSGPNHKLSLLNPTEFKSTILNIVANAKEAGAKNCNVEVIFDKNKYVIYLINDGLLIPNEIKSELFLKDFTYDKKNGTGYGLYHAKKYLNKWNGDIILKSSQSGQTVFELTVPTTDIPNIQINEDTDLLIMEDQATERKALVEYAQQITSKEKIKTFLNTTELNFYLNNHENSDDFLLLADNDVGASHKKGLDYILHNKLESKSFLVTNSFDDSKVMQVAFQNDVSVIPKVLFGEYLIHKNLS